MAWNNPRKGWHWLLLVTPSVQFLLINFVADRWGYLFLPPGEFLQLTLPLYTLIAVFALSIGLGLWLAWPVADLPIRIGRGVGWGFAIAFVNLVIVLGSGCALGSVLRRFS